MREWALVLVLTLTVIPVPTFYMVRLQCLETTITRGLLP